MGNFAKNQFFDFLGVKKQNNWISENFIWKTITFDVINDFCFFFAAILYFLWFVQYLTFFYEHDVINTSLSSKIIDQYWCKFYGIRKIVVNSATKNFRNMCAMRKKLFKKNLRGGLSGPLPVRRGLKSPWHRASRILVRPIRHAARAKKGPSSLEKGFLRAQDR